MKTKTYLLNCKSIPLSVKSLVMPKRREMLSLIKSENEKKLSLGAGLLLNYAEIYDYSITENGKPFCAEGSVFFSISHSGDYAMISVSNSEVGCDIQKATKPNFSVSERFFSEYEKELLKKAEDKSRVFTKIWAMKESYSKLTGEGISSVAYFGIEDLTDVYFKVYDSLNDYCIAVCSRSDCFCENAEILEIGKLL